jgi:hypothetical protein
MARPAELKARVAKSINFENEDYLEFERFVGRDNVSKEIRALVKNFVEDQKKGEASSDPMNQVRLSVHSDSRSSRTDINVNTTLDIYLLSNKDIVNYINNIEDIERLATIEARGKVFSNVARNRKLDILPLHKFKKENNLK